MDKDFKTFLTKLRPERKKLCMDYYNAKREILKLKYQIQFYGRLAAGESLKRVVGL